MSESGKTLTGGGTGDLVRSREGDHPLRFLTAGLLILSVVVLVIVAFLIHSGQDPEMVLRVFGILMIVLVAALMVLMRRPVSDLAPVIGLLGTVAGYLMGKGG